MIAADALMRVGWNWNTWHIPCERRRLRSTLSANRIRATRPDAYKPIHSKGAGAQASLPQVNRERRCARRRRKGGYR
jgi:hypothetical protein